MEAANIHRVVWPSFSTLPEPLSWFPVKWDEIIPDDPFHVQRSLYEAVHRGGRTYLPGVNEPVKVPTSETIHYWLECTISPCWELLALSIVSCLWHIFSLVFFMQRWSLSVILRSGAKLSLWAWKWPTCQWFCPSAEAESRWACAFAVRPGVMPASILMGKSSLICQLFFFYYFFPLKRQHMSAGSFLKWLL